MDSFGNVKLCDFGWATHSIHKKRKTICGTYDYMAPQLIFDELYDYTVDIWALGILLYELLHGVTPFPQDSIEYARKTMKKREIKYYEDISIEAKQLIGSILAFNPKMRLSINAIKDHPWVRKMKDSLNVIPIKQ